MANIFRNAATWLQNKRSVSAVVNITYDRSGLSTPFECWVGKTEYEDVTAEGIIIRNETRDYAIKISAFEDIYNVPEVGDTIKEIINDAVVEFKVLKPLGAPHYKRDAHFLFYKIHTKRITEE